MVISASCGIEPNRVIAYKPLLDEAIEMSEVKPEHCIVLQRDTLTCEMTVGRDVDYTIAVEAAKSVGEARMRTSARHRPTLHTLYIGNDRPTEGRRA